MRRKRPAWFWWVVIVGIVVSLPLWSVRRTVKQEQNRLRLFHSIRHNDTNTVRVLLESGVDANTCLRESARPGFVDQIKIMLHLKPQPVLRPGMSALMQAVVGNGDPEIVRLLLEHAASVNSVDSSGWMPLIAAMTPAQGHPRREIIQLLLERGADPNVRPTGGDAALFYAMDDGRDLGLMTKMLLDYGADPMLTERTGRSYLTSEVWAKHPKTVAYMLNHGANINARDNEWQMGDSDGKGVTPLSAAIATGQLGMVRMLLARGACIAKADRTGLIGAVALLQDESLLKTLLAKGIGIDCKDRRGFTPLMNTAYGGRNETGRQIASMTWLLRHGASVRERNNARQSPLFMACWYPQDLPKLKMLLAHGADPNAREKEGSTPLMYASMAGGASVPYLLAHGANARLVNSAGQTALMRAAEIDKGHPEAIALLAAAGCDPNARDKKGRTALTLARQRHHIAVIQALRKAGAVR